MAVDSIKKGFRVPEKKITPIVKPEPKVTSASSNQYANSKLSSVNYTGSMTKYRLQAANFNAQTNNTTPTQKADEIISKQGSRINNSEAYDMGREVAEIAATDQQFAVETADRILDRLQTTSKSDNFSSGLVDNLTDDQLFEIGKTADGKALLERMHSHLLQGNVSGAERDQAARLLRAIPTDEVIDTGRAVDARSGEEAAARLLNDDNYFTAEANLIKANDFYQTVELRKNDPEFLQEMYNALGPEKVAELMNDSVNALRRDWDNFPTEQSMRDAYGTMASALEAMPYSFEYEVGKAAATEGNPNAGLILSQPEAGIASQRGFLDGIKDSALGDSYDADFHARMAAEVLSSNPGLFREYLSGRETSYGFQPPKWSADEVTKLFTNGLSTPPIGDSMRPEWDLFRAEGIERLVGMTADLRGEAFADFRGRVFRDGSNALGKYRAGSSLTEPLLNNLKTLFESNPRELVDSLFNNTGLPGSPFDQTGQALSYFFRDALFGNPDPKDPFVSTVSDIMGDLRAEMLNPDNLNSDTFDNERYAKVLGDMLGSIAVGYGRAVKQNGNDQKANEALVKTLVGLASKPLKAGGTVGSIAKSQAENIVTNLFSDLLNGDLKAEAKNMQEIVQRLFQNAFAGARDFDSQHDTLTETAGKTEAVWINFLDDIF